MGIAGVPVRNAWTPRVGEFYSAARSYAFGIVVKDVWHGLMSPSADDILPGTLVGWTFNPGRICANVASEANGAPRLRVNCSTAHLLIDGDLVMLVNMNSALHDKPTRVTRISETDFFCDDIPYAAGAGASSGLVKVPAHLRAGEGSDGIYEAQFRICATASASAKLFQFVISVETTEAINTLSSIEIAGATAAPIANGPITVTAGDRVWAKVANKTNKTDITVLDCNFRLHKIANV